MRESFWGYTILSVQCYTEHSIHIYKRYVTRAAGFVEQIVEQSFINNAHIYWQSKAPADTHTYHSLKFTECSRRRHDT